MHICCFLHLNLGACMRDMVVVLSVGLRVCSTLAAACTSFYRLKIRFFMVFYSLKTLCSKVLMKETASLEPGSPPPRANLNVKS